MAIEIPRSRFGRWIHLSRRTVCMSHVTRAQSLGKYGGWSSGDKFVSTTANDPRICDLHIPGCKLFLPFACNVDQDCVQSMSFRLRRLVVVVIGIVLWVVSELSEIRMLWKGIQTSVRIEKKGQTALKGEEEGVQGPIQISPSIAYEKKPTLPRTTKKRRFNYR